LELVFEEARSGIAQITVFECIGLRNIDPLGQQDPFVQFSLGRHYKKRTKSVKGGGTEPYYNEEELLLWLDQDNWVEDLRVEVLDEDAKEERPIGTTHFSLLPYMKRLDEVVKEESYDLFYTFLVDPKDDTTKKEVASGQIIMRVSLLLLAT
jgi:Ca2+-dependent lipid-binding protein